MIVVVERLLTIARADQDAVIGHRYPARAGHDDVRRTEELAGILTDVAPSDATLSMVQLLVLLFGLVVASV